MTQRLRFGIFLAPFHKPGINPTLALQSEISISSNGWIAAAMMRRGSASITPLAPSSPPLRKS